MQACWQEMKWGVFFVQEMKWLGVLFVKKWTVPPQNETKMNQTLLFILHFTYWGAPPVPTGLEMWDCD